MIGNKRYDETPLSEYIADSKAYKKGLESVIGDIELALKESINIYHVVDFSELFAYLLPQEASAEFFLFSRIDQQDASLERLVLHHFLYSLSDHVQDLRDLPTIIPTNSNFSEYDALLNQQSNKVLLPPYAREFQNFIQGMQNDAFTNIIWEATRRLRARNEVLNDPEFEVVLNLLKQSSEELDTDLDSKNRIVQFLMRNSKWLAIYQAPPTVNSLSVAKRLLRNKVLIDPIDIHPALTEFQFVPNTSFEMACYEGILKVRSKAAAAATFNDAQALAMTAQINSFLRERKAPVQLRFMTRSLYMHVLYDSSMSYDYKVRRIQLKPDLRAQMGDIIRHPRMFNILHRIRHLSAEEKLQDLKSKLNLVNTFLEQVENASPTKRGSLLNSPQLQEKLFQISEHWINKQALTASVDDLTGERDFGLLLDVSAKIKQLLFSLQDHAQLNEDLSQGIDSLEVKFDRGYSLLGSFVYTQSGKTTDSVPLQIENHYGNKVVYTDLVTVPYVIVLYSKLAQELDTQFKTGRTLFGKAQRDLIQEIFSRAFFREVNYELLLLIGYIYGILNNWRLAQQFCDWAIEEVEREQRSGNRNPYHEVYLFHAICMRKYNPYHINPGIIAGDEAKKSSSLERETITALSRFSIAHNSLTQAISLRYKYYATKNEIPISKDPRHLKELGAQIIVINKYYAPDNTQREQYKIPLIDKCIGYFDEAEQLLVNADERDKIQIYNNRIVYWSDILAETGNLTEHETHQLESDYKRLLSFMLIQDNDPEAWPPQILDTIAWAGWLTGKMSKSEAEQYLLIAGRSEDSNLNHLERKNLTQHIKTVTSNKKYNMGKA